MSTERKNKDQEELVAGLKARSSESMTYLVENYSAAIYGIISRIIHNDEIADEVLQDAFMKFWDKIHHYDSSKGRFFTWMMNISRNLAIDKLRSKEIRKSDKTADITNYVTEIGSDTAVDQQTDAIGLKEMLVSLREEERFVLEMVYFKGYTQSEIAEEFDIALGTVKTRLRMALINVRKKLGVS